MTVSASNSNACPLLPVQVSACAGGDHELCRRLQPLLGNNGDGALRAAVHITPEGLQAAQRLVPRTEPARDAVDVDVFSVLLGHYTLHLRDVSFHGGSLHMLNGGSWQITWQATPQQRVTIVVKHNTVAGSFHGNWTCATISFTDHPVENRPEGSCPACGHTGVLATATLTAPMEMHPDGALQWDGDGHLTNVHDIVCAHCGAQRVTHAQASQRTINGLRADANPNALVDRHPPGQLPLSLLLPE